jgi:hypothetical protein
MRRDKRVRVTLKFSDEEWAAILQVVEMKASRFVSTFIRSVTREAASRFLSR